MTGTGLPEAEHSRVTSVPFLTTMLPSSGLGLTLGGTANEKIVLHKEGLCFLGDNVVNQEQSFSLCLPQLALNLSSVRNKLAHEKPPKAVPPLLENYYF